MVNSWLTQWTTPQSEMPDHYMVTDDDDDVDDVHLELRFIWRHLYELLHVTQWLTDAVQQLGRTCVFVRHPRRCHQVNTTTKQQQTLGLQTSVRTIVQESNSPMVSVKTIVWRDGDVVVLQRPCQAATFNKK